MGKFCLFFLLLIFLWSGDTGASVPEIHLKPTTIRKPVLKKKKNVPIIFDIPVSYNKRVRFWIRYFQGSGRKWFHKWLQRSTRYLPMFKKVLRQHGLPQDLAYLAMIESGFSTQAKSTASAVGPWQFIRDTGKRFGLKINWWIDERKDFYKSTVAAAKYMRNMYGMFNNWYLVAAGYNTGENRVKRIIRKRKTKNFWKMARNKDLHPETRDYVPKLIAAMLIAKSPKMYGFRKVHYQPPFRYEHFNVPGGTRLDHLANAIGVTHDYMKDLNPALLKSYIPGHIKGYRIRIPKGSANLVSRYVRHNLVGIR